MKPRILPVLAWTIVWLPVLALAQSGGEGVLWEDPHREYVPKFEGTRTCLECHEDEARDVFRSLHYQWSGDAPDVTNAGGRKIGKINSTNDFCTNPSISWIAILKNDEGKVIANGCSKCHAGLGLKPAAQESREQLENIDCLVCHSDNYRRHVVKREDGSLRWEPVALQNPEAMRNIAQHPVSPGNAACLRCHVGAGGGLNFKRGDLETGLFRARRDFDVHLGSGMSCTQCHKFERHQVLGSGTQMAGSDRPEGKRPACEGCHRGAIHAREDLDRHARRIDCTTCHVPTFARKDATGMHRDWSRTEPVEGEGRFEPAITFAKDVTPAYAWWNGRGRIVLLDEPLPDTGPGERVRLYTPEGSRKDPAARIFPFKRHTARLPFDPATRKLLPIKVGMAFKTGDAMAAVRAGAKEWTGHEVQDIGWVETERMMGIFHGVVPKENALKCADCHDGGIRMDWKALGYGSDPKTGRKGKAATGR